MPDLFTGIDYILLSHDHGDHFNEKSLKKLLELNSQVTFLTGLKMDELISLNKIESDYRWIPINNSQRFFADPFIFMDKDGKVNVIYEDFSFDDQYGKISLTGLDEHFNPVFTKEILFR